MAVLDNKARVYGVQNLRVVDASSFPFLTPGHPISVIYALAEKIAADILGGATPPPGYELSGYEEDSEPAVGLQGVGARKEAEQGGASKSGRVSVGMVALVGFVAAMVVL